ncbi:MAG TPA: energy transducer TonB [Verrucomicrobiae bacterium]|nr:energy transducer TonB [Verrucomicrobiae bacterium]
MKGPLRLCAVLLPFLSGGVFAQGELLKQVRDSNRAATQLNAEREARFVRARDEQARLLAETLAEVRRHEGRVASAKQRWTVARATSAVLEKKVAVATRELDTLYDAARGAAVDLHDTAEKSLVTAQFPERMEVIAPLAASQTLPGPAELETLWRALQQEMKESGTVATFSAAVAGESGKAQREVTRIGVFTVLAAGAADAEYFVLQSGGRALVEMERQPPRRYRGLAEEFRAARSGYATMLLDPSRGPLLVAEANRPGLFERLWRSGVGGYFIAGILLLAIALAVMQSVWLRSRLIIDEQSISVTVAILVAFALIQWWLWQPGEPSANESVAMVELVSEEEPESEEEVPEPELTPPPAPPSMPASTSTMAQLPALAMPSAAPVVSNIQVPVKIGGGSSLAGAGFAGFARGEGAGFGRGQGFKGKELVPLSTARPQMPEWACKQGIKGWVEAVFTVMPNGRVQDVKIVDAQPRGVYEIAAIESINNWIYAETDRAREVKQRVPMDPADCAFNWR